MPGFGTYSVSLALVSRPRRPGERHMIWRQIVMTTKWRTFTCAAGGRRSLSRLGRVLRELGDPIRSGVACLWASHWRQACNGNTARQATHSLSRTCGGLNSRARENGVTQSLETVARVQMVSAPVATLSSRSPTLVRPVHSKTDGAATCLASCLPGPLPLPLAATTASSSARSLSCQRTFTLLGMCQLGSGLIWLSHVMFTCVATLTSNLCYCRSGIALVCHSSPKRTLAGLHF